MQSPFNTLNGGRIVGVATCCLLGWANEGLSIVEFDWDLMNSFTMPLRSRAVVISGVLIQRPLIAMIQMMKIAMVLVVRQALQRVVEKSEGL